MKLKELQKSVEGFCRKNNLNTSSEFRLIDLISELGELSKEFLKSSDYGKKKVLLTENMKGEFGDVLFSLIITANTLDVNLEEELNKVLEKYSGRMKKGNPGSEEIY